MKLLQDTCGVRSWYKLENLEEWAIQKSYWITAITEFGYLETDNISGLVE